ncbi:MULTISPECIES: hypothetical protein [unclassified Bradyrhizobium]|uniref:hypothetical protein n=1 Tax=unclassified Bradyrhizobium TaxID=2631580 RepID=UPI002479FEC3|nr:MULTISPECIES: hypothetical protein [unclassified Bradyrhizobium]WGR69298.1 hypothetical protein MTX24_28260 [Bradyrhizobium sp. ISRA426]WGR81353.1 hypothetical protein MTX21_13375 [Bradyrhizobium sp. ISRA430]WGR84537.1 hypothetical protein MTX25_27940 [Bradyrhizobium sp. ISRA432]
MYELIKKQTAADYFQTRFANDGQRFVAWYLRNILFRDMNETRDDITDGSNDKQIDAIVIDNDKTLVHIVQGKFIQGDTVDAEPLREILSSWLQIKDLARLQNVANPKLQRKLSELAAALDEDYEVSFELIVTGMRFTRSPSTVDYLVVRRIEYIEQRPDRYESLSDFLRINPLSTISKPHKAPICIKHVEAPFKLGAL